MKNLFIILFTLLLLVNASSCKKEEDPVDPDVSDTSDGYSHESPDDYVWDNASLIDIIMNGNSVSCSSNLVEITGTTAVIRGAGNFRITGSLTSGQLKVDADSSALVRLILDNAAITNPSGPALLVEKSLKTIINLASGSTNNINDGAVYANPQDSPNAALFSKSDFTIFGEGTLAVKGNFKDGISGKDGVLIKSGTINIESVDDGLCGKDYLIIKGGDISVNASGDGLKSDDASNSAVGYVLINDGNITINAGADGISAFTNVVILDGEFNITSGGGSDILPSEISSKGIKGLNSIKITKGDFHISSSDDAVHTNNFLQIASGTFIVSSASNGFHADDSAYFINPYIQVNKSDEGVEAKYILVQNGTIIIRASDDAFNATAGASTEQNDQSMIYIDGGLIVLNTTKGDGIDSNGNIMLNDGTLLIHGPESAPETGFDYNGTFNINGGLLVVSGTNSALSQPPSQSSSQNSVKVNITSLLPASTIFHINDSQGNHIVTFEPERAYQSMIVSSPLLLTGKTYEIYTSGSTTGTDNYGLFEGGIYTPGNKVAEFVINDRITILNF